MVNQYPLWKYILIVAVLLAGTLYSLPNLYGEDPAVQVSVRSGAMDIAETSERITELLKQGGVQTFDLEPQNERLLIRFASTEEQLTGRDLLEGGALGANFLTALNLAPATPKWLRSLNAAPMYLGLDLRGGVHFLMQVDMETAVAQAEERYVSEIRTYLREQKIRYLGIRREAGRIETRFKTPELRDQALDELQDNYRDLVYETSDSDRFSFIYAVLSEEAVKLERDAALEQNIITLRNRVNELGVAEPIVQRQGFERIVVQLPGVQDTTRAKEILGATATLEYRMVHGSAADWDAAASSGNVPVNARLYRERDGSPVLLERRVIVTGDQIKDASAGFDPRTPRRVSISRPGSRPCSSRWTAKAPTGCRP
jgi:preprotein translocase subunit SecD